MNISNLREPDFEKNQETVNDGTKIGSKPNLTTSSWSRLKDPRIVRVSRAFGGKDRHSKVCTVRGLRDRRVRLSVPTAIQLYDLQDRLGLNQPSKVVDWLLNVAKHEIDELPPLQIPPGCFPQGFQATLGGSSQSDRTEGAKTSNSSINWEDCWNPDKSKAISQENNEDYEENDQENPRSKHNDHGTFVQNSNFFTRNPSSLLNNVIPNSFLKWDPSNLSLSQFGSYDTVHNFNMNVAALPSIPSGSQLLLYPPPPPPQPPPPPPQTQSYFPSHDQTSSGFDPKHLNFQMLSSSGSNFTPPLYTINEGMKPFHLSMNPKYFSCDQENGGNEANK